MSNTNSSFKESIRRHPRRTSVTPPSHNQSHAANAFDPSHNYSSSGVGNRTADKLRRMSTTLFSSLGDSRKTREAIKAVLEDPSRVEYRRLKAYNEQLVKDWKQVKRFIEQLQTEYVQGKQLDPIRRYHEMCAMTKRVVMHVRLSDFGTTNTITMTGNGYGAVPIGGSGDSSESPDSPLHHQGSVLQSETKVKEMEKRIDQLCSSFSVEELAVENRRIRSYNDRLETRIELITQTINELDLVYRSSKSESYLRRYSCLKSALKGIVNNCELLEAP